MIIILLILGFILLSIGVGICDYSKGGVITLFIGIVLFISMFIIGITHGFINYPATEGTHQGVITAVDREGVIFNHYRVYLKSSAYTSQGDETEYCAYLEETELIKQLQEYVGKQVKLHYSHKGGYIGIKSCGTYHIDSVELVEE
jgi:hypothetical protein